MKLDNEPDDQEKFDQKALLPKGGICNECGKAKSTTLYRGMFSKHMCNDCYWEHNREIQIGGNAS